MFSQVKGMAAGAPKTLARTVPTLVPRLVEVASDVRTEVPWALSFPIYVHAMGETF